MVDFNDGGEARVGGTGTNAATANGINRKTIWRGMTAPSFTVDGVTFPEAHMLWEDTSTTPAVLKVYNGTAWIALSPDVGTALRILAQNELRFADADNSNYVGFKAPATISANKIWTLPAVDGSSKDFLATDGAGVLSFIDPNANEINFDDVFDAQFADGTAHTIKTYTLPANSYRKILVLITGIITFPDTLQTAGSFSVNLKFGGVTKKSQSYSYPNWATGHNGSLKAGLSMVYAQAQTSSVAIDITVSGGDVNNVCTVSIDGFYVFGLQ